MHQTTSSLSVIWIVPGGEGTILVCFELGAERRLLRVMAMLAVVSIVGAVVSVVSAVVVAVVSVVGTVVGVVTTSCQQLLQIG